MSSALAPADLGLDEFELPPLISSAGAQTLLALKGTKPSFWTQSTALLLYALVLATAFTYAARPAPPVEEDAIERGAHGAQEDPLLRGRFEDGPEAD